MGFLRLNSGKSHQHGAVLIEAAIILPVIVLLILVLFDMFFVANSYLAVNQMVREGVQTGATLSEFSGGTQSGSVSTVRYSDIDVDSEATPDGFQNDPFPNSGYSDDSVEGCLSAELCGHYKILWRINQIFKSINPVQTHIVEDMTFSAYNSSTNIITVQITATYSGMTPIFFGEYKFALVASGLTQGG